MSQEDRLTGLVGFSGMKVPVKAATTAAITLSGEQTIDGIACVSDDRVLVKDQASAVNNGIYVVDTGDWTRSPDADGAYDFVAGTLVPVFSGSVNGGAVFRLTTSGTITPGTSSLSFSSMGLLSTPVAVASGGTGAATAIAGLANLGVVQVTAEAGTNTITGTVDALVTALRADQLFIMTPAVTNTGATTAEFTPSGGSSLGAKNVFWDGAACVGGELVASVPVILQYDGTQFNIVGNAAALPAGYFGAVGDVLVGTAAQIAKGVSAPPLPINLTLAFSVSGNALTVAVKTRAGNDPSSASPVLIPFRNVNQATGDYSWITLTAATSITVPDTATLGTSNSVAFKPWVVAFNDGGTVRLAVINCLSGSNIYPLGQQPIASATQVGVGSDSAHVFYSNGAAVSSKAYTILGWASWESGLATAGTWSSGPSKLQLYGPGIPLPGTVVQNFMIQDSTATSTATALPIDNTKPQNTEGAEFTQVATAITPSSAANMLDIEVLTYLTRGAASNGIVAALFQDTTVDALAVGMGGETSGSTHPCPVTVRHRQIAATTSATTFKLRYGGSAGTTYINQGSGGALFNGTLDTTMNVLEISV